MTDDEIEEIRETFSHFDRDGNGRIDRREFSQLLDALEADMSDDEIEQGLRELDADGNGTIEFDEFLAWWSDQ